MIQIDVMTPEMIAAGIGTNSRDIAYILSPKPGSGTFLLNISGLNTTKANIHVYSLAGALVYASDSDISNGSLSKEIHLDNVPGGVYFIKVDAGKNTYTKKLIVNR